MKDHDEVVESELESLPLGMIKHLDIERASNSGPPGHIQTHISHLFLTCDRVYKVRKAVRFPFLSFATRNERNQDCLDEVRLNRRLASSVYLGVAALEQRGDHWVVGEVQENIHPHNVGLEHCVVMRRLRDDGDGQSLLKHGLLGPKQIDATAMHVAAFHARNGLGVPAPWSAVEWRDRIEAPVMDSLNLIETRAFDPGIVERAQTLRACFHKLLNAHAADIEQRRLEGRAVEGHGDLQLAHVWFDKDDETPSIIDCTEFNEDFRKIDVANEVAFFAMDLTYRGTPKLAERFLASYAEASGDYGLYTIVDLYAAYRSIVRAKVALLAADDIEITASQRTAARASAERHLELAENLFRPRQAGFVAIMCGTVGSGKSSVAHEFAAACGGVLISSDCTRKRLAGMQPGDHSAAGGPPNEGLYTRERTTEVYDVLLEHAASVSAAGRVAVIDASYTAVRQRAAARDWARERCLQIVLLEVRCAEEEALARLTARKHAGTDVSDAGPDFLTHSLAHFEAPTEWPDQSKIIVATDAPDWQPGLRAAAEAQWHAWRDGGIGG